MRANLAVGLILAAMAIAADTKTPAPNPTITDTQRLRVREIEAEFANSQIVVMREQAKQKDLQAEYTKAVTEMSATCKDSDWDGKQLKCVPKVAAKAEETKK